MKDKILLFFIFIFSISCLFLDSVFAEPGIQTGVVSNNIFVKLGIELKENIANTYYTGDNILIRGRVTDNKKHVIFYLRNINTWEEISDLYSTNTNGSFQIPVAFPNGEWKYYIIIASGNSFAISNPEIITLINKNTLSSGNTLPFSNTLRPNIVYEKSPYLYFGSNMWSNMKIIQGKQLVQKSGKIIILKDIPLKQGNAKISMNAYALSTSSSLDQIQWSWKSWVGNIYLDRMRDIIWKDLVSLRVIRNTWIMQFRLKRWTQVSSTYFVTSPNGQVTKYSFPKENIDSNWFLRTELLIKETFPMPDSGIYKIETVLSNGYAYFNLPISKIQFWSIIQLFSESQLSTLRNDKSKVDNNVLSKINTLRERLNIPPIVLDSTLSDLAQKKAMDMAKYNYVWHISKDGMSIIEFATSQNIPISGSIWENVAGWNVSDMSLQDGLEESGSHRYNMIDSRWKKIGIGYVLQNGKTYIVQIFGE